MGDRIHQLLTTTPRQPTTPTPTQAQTAAQHAITNADWGAVPQPHLSLRERARQAAFRRAEAVGMPLYRLSIRLGLHWMEGVRQRVAALLQPR
jgi:hypothetical protein